jgi:hypothetical protein
MLKMGESRQSRVCKTTVYDINRAFSHKIYRIEVLFVKEKATKEL